MLPGPAGAVVVVVVAAVVAEAARQKATLVEGLTWTQQVRMLVEEGVGPGEDTSQVLVHTGTPVHACKEVSSERKGQC